MKLRKNSWRNCDNLEEVWYIIAMIKRMRKLPVVLTRKSTCIFIPCIPEVVLHSLQEQKHCLFLRKNSPIHPHTKLEVNGLGEVSRKSRKFAACRTLWFRVYFLLRMLSFKTWFRKSEFRFFLHIRLSGVPKTALLSTWNHGCSAGIRTVAL